MQDNKDLAGLALKFEELRDTCNGAKAGYKGPLSIIKAIIAYNLKAHFESIFALNEDPRPLAMRELDNAISFFSAASEFSGTFEDAGLKELGFCSQKIKEIEEKVSSLYGSLWVDFSDESYFGEAYKLLKTRLQRNNIDLGWFTGKKILDAGCGGGRYTYALAQLGASSVTGIDIGKQGIMDARERIKGREHEEKIEFIEGSVLELPFKEATFDFVFSNGVLHHTKSTEKGISEIFRVLKKGGGVWLYLYGDGGIEEMLFKYIREILKDVPRELTQSVMTLMGLPSNRRFYMLDHFYVDIRNTYSLEAVEQMLKDAGFSEIKRLIRGTDFDTCEKVFQGKPYVSLKYGTGDLRFIAEK